MRCRERQGHLDIWREACGQEYIVEPENYFEIIENFALAEAGVLAGSAAASSGYHGSGYYEQHLVQMKPQKADMKLRISKIFFIIIIVACKHKKLTIFKHIN